MSCWSIQFGPAYARSLRRRHRRFEGLRHVMKRLDHPLLRPCAGLVETTATEGSRRAALIRKAFLIICTPNLLLLLPCLSICKTLEHKQVHPAQHIHDGAGHISIRYGEGNGIRNFLSGGRSADDRFLLHLLVDRLRKQIIAVRG